MLPADHLPADLREAVAVTARQPIAELLLQRGILRQTASDLLLQRLRDAVSFTPEEEPLVLTRLWDGVPGDPPTSLQGDWIASLPELIQGPLRDRWNQIRLQKWIETTYLERLEPYFLERRADLEQVVYGMIRLRNQGAAEELYLRLLDDNADFGSLARSHSLGEERYTRGLVGPMLISQPHATIRAVLSKLTVGEVHPPFRVDNWVLLVQMEHRLPASLTDATRLQLYNELFQQDLEATLDQQLQAIYPTLLPQEVLPQEVLPQELPPQEPLAQDLLPPAALPPEPVIQDLQAQDTVLQDMPPQDESPVEPVAQDLQAQDMPPPAALPPEPVIQELQAQDTAPQDMPPQDESPVEPVPQELLPQEPLPQDSLPQDLAPPAQPPVVMPLAAWPPAPSPPVA